MSKLYLKNFYSGITDIQYCIRLRCTTPQPDIAVYTLWTDEHGELPSVTVQS